MELGNRDRNASLDITKGIAAILVCFQHAYVPNGAVGGVLSFMLSVSRIAVPLFAMVSGYLYCDVMKRGTEKKQIKKFFFIALQMVCFYFAVELLFNIGSRRGGDYIKSIFTAKAWLKFLVFNDPIPADHSWYMWAMLYVLVLVYLIPFIIKRKGIRNLIILTSIILQIFLSKYFFLISKDAPSALTYRNFAIPIAGYFCLGITLAEHRKQSNSGSMVNRKNEIIIGFLLMFGLVALWLEEKIIIRLGCYRESGTYLFATVSAFMLFSFILSLKNNNMIGKCIAVFGRKYSLYFYILHPLFIRIRSRVIPATNMTKFILGLLLIYLATFISTIILTKIIYKIHSYRES